MVRRRRWRLLTTPRSRELRALAAQWLPTLVDDADAVALTGSAARGNARADADLDLWVLGRWSGRATLVRDGVSVTLLCQRPAEAMALDNLCFYEVDDLLVLRDVGGVFARLTKRWRQHRRTLRARILATTDEQLAWELERASRGSALHRATFLRLAGWRLACTFVFLEKGWRVPRLHLLDEALPRAEASRLHRVLGLPPDAACRRAVGLVPSAVAQLERLLDERRLDVPEAIAAKARSNPREAAFLALRSLVLEWLPEVFARYGVTDVKGVELLDRAPAAQRLFVALSPPVTDRALASLRRDVLALGRNLGLSRRRALAWFFR